MREFACCLLLCSFGVRASEPPPPPPEPEAVRPFRRNVRLHLLSDDARIELQDAEGKTVCKTPCNADVPVLYGDSFTLSGPGLRSSDAFAFDRDDTDVTLRVHAGSGGRVIGYVFAGLGGGIALTSLAWLGLASIPSPAQDGRPVTVGSGPYIGLGVGLAIAALGGLVILNTRPTTEFSREP